MSNVTLAVNEATALMAFFSGIAGCLLFAFV
jgi:hypothetical protein